MMENRFPLVSVLRVISLKVNRIAVIDIFKTSHGTFGLYVRLQVETSYAKEQKCIVTNVIFLPLDLLTWNCVTFSKSWF